MNKEQRAYINIINDSSPTEIYIKKTGWEGVNLDNHSHPKFQIIYAFWNFENSDWRE